MNGKVYLVGAGPGDSGLITVRGMELIRLADVIVYDRLIGQSIREMLPEHAEKIDVGKNAGDHPVPQQEINALLVSLAKAGKTVVRLKGGDPFVFGRGGEELELLQKHGIDFEVVPGVTAAISVPAYAGIPVTHREHASSLHIITGHAQADKKIKIDYEALARLDGTLVFMMGVSTAEDIMKGLLNAGMDPEMPCAVIENGTLPKQRAYAATLEHLAELVRKKSICSPAVILTGRVCNLSEQLSWYTKRPLLGKRVLVTQPAPRSGRLAGGLRDLGAEAILYPCIRTVPIRPLIIPDLYSISEDSYNTIVFTSAEGVRSSCEWILECGHDMRCFAGKRIACIGSATAAALRKYGIVSDFVPSEFNGKTLGREMIKTGFVHRGSNVLLFRTANASRDITESLAGAGIRFKDIPVYETEYVEQSPLDGLEEIDLITFTSRSCVEGFVRSQQADQFRGIRALCIGHQTACVAAEHGFSVTVSAAATVDSMLDKIVEILPSDPIADNEGEKQYGK